MAQQLTDLQFNPGGGGVGILCLESIHLSLIHLHDARVYFLYWLGPLGLTDHQPNIYTSQPKYDFEWFCILMTCTQQWPRSSKFSTLHNSTIFTHEEDLSAFKTLSLCMYDVCGCICAEGNLTDVTQENSLWSGPIPDRAIIAPYVAFFVATIYGYTVG